MAEVGGPIDRWSLYNSGFTNMRKKPLKAHVLPMKYSRMLFLSKYYTLIANILPKMEHSVKKMLKK